MFVRKKLIIYLYLILIAIRKKIGINDKKLIAQMYTPDQELTSVILDEKSSTAKFDNPTAEHFAILKGIPLRVGSRKHQRRRGAPEPRGRTGSKK